MQMVYVWLIVFVVGICLELPTAGSLVSIWISIGAIIPMFMGIYKTTNPVYITLQVVIFGVVTALCLIFLRKFAVKVLYKKNNEKTNLDILTGKKVTVKFQDDEPTVKLNGVVYTVLCDDNLQDGDTVEVVHFQGSKLVVKK